MGVSMYLTGRDIEILNEVCRFGFTTIDHITMRYAVTLSKGYRRISKLVNLNYLKYFGRSKVTKRKIYIPDHMFYRNTLKKDISKLNLVTYLHDEYILQLYSNLMRFDLCEELYLEQDIKKEDFANKKQVKIPDIIAKSNGKKFIFEYERTIKNERRMASINRAYKYDDNPNNYFIFLCEDESIAKRVKDKIEIKNIYVLSAARFLEQVITNKHSNLLEYIEDKYVQFNKGGNK